MTRQPIQLSRSTAAPPGAAFAVADARRVALLLDRVLSALALLALRTRTSRWSIVAPELWALRDALDDHHARLDVDVDALAERMCALGAFPGGASDGWHELAASGDLALDGSSTAEDAIEDLISDADHAAKLVACAASSAPEDAADLAVLLGRIEQDVLCMRWSLRSLADALLAPAEGVRCGLARGDIASTTVAPVEMALGQVA